MGNAGDPRRIGDECARAFAEYVRLIPEVLSRLPDAATEAFASMKSCYTESSIEDIDKELLYRELVILLYLGERLAIQHAGLPSSKMKEVCAAFDKATSEFIPHDWDDILDERGLQYFTILKSHSNEINGGDWGGFNDELRFKFEQFCLGGGGENDPISNGSFRAMMPLAILAKESWIHAFMGTLKFVKESDL
jgi:hypothetical protein